jgi:hypothetical protein
MAQQQSHEIRPWRYASQSGLPPRIVLELDDSPEARELVAFFEDRHIDVETTYPNGTERKYPAIWLPENGPPGLGTVYRGRRAISVFLARFKPG